MIKRLIFDIDDTLIPFRDEYYEEMIAFTKTYIKSDISIDELFEFFDGFEIDVKYYNKDELVKYVYDKFKVTIDDDIYLKFIDLLSNMVKDEDKEIEEVLKNLSSKYELVCLTNWYKDAQINRLKKIDCYKYFDEVYACDTFLRKPYKEGYYLACGDYSFDECCMVGNSFEFDIDIPNKLGMKTIYLNKDKIELKNNICIERLEEIINFL